MDPESLIAEHLLACDAEPLAVLGFSRLDQALRRADRTAVCKAALKLCLSHNGPLRDARLVMSYAATVATDAERIALGRKPAQIFFPNDPDVFFHVANTARLLSGVALATLMQALPTATDQNLAVAFGVAAVLAARREGCPVPDAVLPLLRGGLQTVNRIDETLLCEVFDGPWSRVWPDAASRPWLFRIGDSSVDLERLGAFETVALAVAGELGDGLVKRWQAAPEGAERIRYAAALSWGVPLSRVGEVLAILPTRSWRERQSLLHALLRHGDAILPALDVALSDERTQAIAAQVWLELPLTDAVSSRTEQVRARDPDKTAERLRMDGNLQIGLAKSDRTMDPRPTAWQMMKAYLRAGRNVTSEVLAPAHAALDAADRSGIIAAWLFFESITVTKAAEPNIMSLGEPWRGFVERTTKELPGLIHLARALLALPDRDGVECAGASAILWAGPDVDQVLTWLIHHDPPSWAVI